jgi:hypothetical protein
VSVTKAQEAVLAKRLDPLGCDVELVLTGRFYPAGFPLRIATNSEHVLKAAAESWAPVARQFDVRPMRFRVVVEERGELADEPTYRKQWQLLSFVSDAHNFAAGDCRTLTATIHLSQKTAEDHAVMRWYYLEAMAYMLLTQRYVVSLHTACVARGDAGILICGKSGAGKSTLSFASARAGFTYVADDCVWMLANRSDHIAIGKPHQVRFRHDVARHFPELEGYVASHRPNGKLSIEVPMGLFPAIRTANQAQVRALVFVDRESPGPARVERVQSRAAAERLLTDLPSYGPEVNAVHEATVLSLAELPAWTLYYRELDDAIALLRELPVGG